MEEEKEQKRLCSGNGVLEVDVKCDQQGSTAFESNQEGKVIRTIGTGFDGSGRELRNFHADLLVEVFSSLHQGDLVEVMLVCRQWETAVWEGSRLWRKLRVHGEWRKESTLEEREKEGANQLLVNALQTAEKVTFVYRWKDDWKPLLSLEGVVAVNLRVLKLPSNCFPADLLPAVLSNCPQLKKLVLGGNLTGQGSIHVSHPRLETFKIRSEPSRPLMVDCPNLTYLDTTNYSYPDDLLICPPSIQCPLLTYLELPPHHCAPAAMELMAANAPLLKSLVVRRKLDSNDMCPSIALRHFSSIQVLHMFDCEEISPRLFDHLPHLVDLNICGEWFTNGLEIRHAHLKSLYLDEEGENASVRLLCPDLENLKFHCMDLDARCLTNLNDTCPMLKRLNIEWYKNDPQQDLARRALDIGHETLEVLILDNTEWIPDDWGSTLQTVVRVACPNLMRLELRGYTDMVRLPSILCTLPRLESLVVSLRTTHWLKVKLQHDRLQTVDLGHGKIDKLVIVMPKLKDLYIVSCLVEKIEVASREIVHLKFSNYLDGSDPLWRTVHPKMARVKADLADERDTDTDPDEVLEDYCSESESDGGDVKSFKDGC